MVGFDDRAEEVEEIVDSDPLVEEGEVGGDLVTLEEMVAVVAEFGCYPDIRSVRNLVNEQLGLIKGER